MSSFQLMCSRYLLLECVSRPDVCFYTEPASERISQSDPDLLVSVVSQVLRLINDANRSSQAEVRWACCTSGSCGLRDWEFRVTCEKMWKMLLARLPGPSNTGRRKALEEFDNGN